MKKQLFTLLTALFLTVLSYELVAEEIKSAKPAEIILGNDVLPLHIQKSMGVNNILKRFPDNKLALGDFDILIGQIKKYYTLLGLEKLLKQLREKQYNIVADKVATMLDLNKRLNIAVASNELVKVNALLNEGADPNTRARSGWTALALAAHLGREAIAQALLDAGADKNILSGRDKKTAAKRAEDANFPELARMIEQYIPARK